MRAAERVRGPARRARAAAATARRPEERPGGGGGAAAAAAEERTGSGPPCPPAPPAPRLLGGAAAAMFSVLSYGRLVARAVLGGLSQTDPRAGGGGGGDYGLVTAGCGFGKDFRKGLLKKGACYGDDACFVARHRTADVLGESPAPVPLPQPRVRLPGTPPRGASPAPGSSRAAGAYQQPGALPSAPRRVFRSGNPRFRDGETEARERSSHVLKVTAWECDQCVLVESRTLSHLVLGPRRPRPLSRRHLQAGS